MFGLLTSGTAAEPVSGAYNNGSYNGDFYRAYVVQREKAEKV